MLMDSRSGRQFAREALQLRVALSSGVRQRLREPATRIAKPHRLHCESLLGFLGDLAATLGEKCARDIYLNLLKFT